MPISDLDHESWRIFRIMAEFVDGFEALENIERGVTIFGSARTRAACASPYRIGNVRYNVVHRWDG